MRFRPTAGYRVYDAEGRQAFSYHGERERSRADHDARRMKGRLVSVDDHDNETEMADYRDKEEA